jgi:8-oxo-dGTP pyrophosphatase MutT (NUDIX family)
VKRYVLGFAFTPDLSRVVLMRKARPEWQSGLLNGIGGHIEFAEASLVAMVREFREEAGANIEQWAPIGEIKGADFSVDVFAGKFSVMQSKNIQNTDESEPVCWYRTESIFDEQTVGNVPCLVAACRDYLRNPFHFNRLILEYP